MTTPDAEAVRGWDAAPPQSPPWAKGPMPDPHTFMESELFVAGAISTRAPFDAFHPAWALPIARQALDALSEWEPHDGGGVQIDGAVAVSVPGEQQAAPSSFGEQQ